MSGFEPRNPAYATHVQSSFRRPRVMEWLGARLTRLAPGECDIELPYRPELTQQHGYFHGGIIGTIADSAGGYAADTLMPEDCSVRTIEYELTIEYKMNRLGPGDDESLSARGRVLKAGRTLVVPQVDALGVKNGRETLCAMLLQTLLTLHGRPDP